MCFNVRLGINLHKKRELQIYVKVLNVVCIYIQGETAFSFNMQNIY